MILAQSGFNAGEKIVKGIKLQFIEGAILNPRYIHPQNLYNQLSDLKKILPEAILLVDPQFFISTVSGISRAGKLPDYPFFRANLNKMDFSPKKIQKYVKDIIEFQNNLPVDYVISPSVIIDDFSGRWSQILLSLFQESVDYFQNNTDNKKLLLSIVIKEQALGNIEGMKTFLDDLTRIEADGHYIIIERVSDNSMWTDTPSLKGILYLTYVLSENDFLVIHGYIDLVGILLYAVGAEHIANGWFKNLKRFSLARYTSDGPRRRGRPEYLSLPLLNSIQIIPDLETIFEKGIINKVLNRYSFDGILKSGPAAHISEWTDERSVLHYWESIKNLLIEINEFDTLKDRIDYLLRKINKAEKLHDELRSMGIRLDRGHLSVWGEALGWFKKEVLV